MVYAPLKIHSLLGYTAVILSQKYAKISEMNSNPIN